MDNMMLLHEIINVSVQIRKRTDIICQTEPQSSFIYWRNIDYWEFKKQHHL